MSRDITRKLYYNRGRDWDRNTYRSHQIQRKRSRSPPSRDKKRRSRSPRKNEKELLEENILSEISKLPEPNELWDSQFQEAGFSGSVAPPPPSFTQEDGGYLNNYQPQYSGIYEDITSSIPPASHTGNVGGWSQVQIQPPLPAQPVFINMEDQIKKEAAIESEMRHQKAALSKQREDCMKKEVVLKKELETLKEQRYELHSDPKRSPSPDTKRFLKENTKLQLEIQNKLKTINNVVDMLNGIIGEEAQYEKNDGEEMTERSSRRKSRSPSTKKFNYVYYDPEMHWCRVCNEFPSTAKDYLTHLHSPSHHKMASAHMEAPWHSVPGMNDGFPNYPSAPTKRTPIRGLQFFVPSTAWYCKLCDQFIGDLHCASAHLKSVVHSKNYTNFVEQNPHWDTDWMSDRQKALEKNRGKDKENKPQYTAHTITFNKDGFHTKRKDSPSATYSSEKKRKKDRKKKKSKKKMTSSESESSSSSSSSDSDSKKTKRKKEKVINEKALSKWMSSIPMNYNERRLLDNLKSRAGGSERRRSRSRDDRGRRDDRRQDDRGEERSRSQRDDRTDRREERKDDGDEKRESNSRSVQMSTDPKKPEIKKMPFIGKMPVFKNLAKPAKNEDQKKDNEKKKHEEEEINKKKRVEMDAEIQKKVAQFKEKIAKAQLEKEQQEIPPELALTAPLGFMQQPALLNPPMPPAQAPNNLPKDFQDALDIIFPSNTKPPELAQQELFLPGLAGFSSIPGVMAPFPQFGLAGVPPVVMGFEMNAQLFQPRPQLYDTQVPIMPAVQKKKPRQQTKAKKNSTSPKQATPMEDDKPNAKNKEEMDELAMLGIDASDVGACI